jgi:hypothetical protein
LQKSKTLHIQGRPSSKPARHLPETQLMEDGQGEAAWGAKDGLKLSCKNMQLFLREPLGL